MTSTIKLKQGDSGTELNLNVGLSSGDAAVGWNIEDWLIQEAKYTEGEKSPLVTETLDLLLKGSSHDNLATRKQSMHQMQVYANKFIQERTFDIPVWLHIQSCGETNERRALVHSIDLSPRSPFLDIKGWPDQNIERYRATIVREPYWEATSPITTISTDQSGISTIGGEWNFTTGGNTVVGDVPARLYQFRVVGNADVVTCEDLWFGFRSDVFHTDLDNFPHLWETNDAYNSSTDTTSDSDAEASGGTRMTCDFSSGTPGEDWGKRITFALEDVTTNMESAYGKYLVLFRAKMSDSDSEVWVKLEHRLRYDLESIVYHEIQEVSGTSWHLYSLGIVTIPYRNIQAITTSLISDTYEKGELYSIWAKRVTGSGDLYLDCLVFIPIDEYFLHLTNAGVETSQYCWISQCPKGNHWTATVDEVEVAVMPQMDSSGIGVPIGNSRLYVAADDFSDDDDRLKFRIQYYPRWLSIRGAE